MKKRLFYTTKVYDYKTYEDALTDREEMRDKGWFICNKEYSDMYGVVTQPDENVEYRYSIEYYKYND